MINGASGQRYHVRPLMMAVDVATDDAANFIGLGDARGILPEDHLKLTGYQARK